MTARSIGFMLLLPGLIILGSLLGRLWWLGDLLSMFLDFALWLLIPLTLFFLWRRAWAGAGLGFLLFLIGGIYLVYTPHQNPDPTAAAESPALRVMVFNIYYQNRDAAAVVAEIRKYDPDVVFLMEYNNGIRAEVEALLTEYPHRMIEPSQRTMGLGLFSRLPLTATELHRFQQTRIPIFEVEFEVEGRPVTFVGGHPWPPQPQWGGLHRAQFQSIIDVAVAAKTIDQPLIVAGDFNATPWSYMMRKLSAAAGVDQVRNNWGLQKTFFPSTGFGLPLDHILISDEWTATQLAYGEPQGSDHLPLILDLNFDSNR